MKVNEITPQRQFNLSKLNSLLQPGQSRSQIIKIIKKVLWDETGEKFRVTAKISNNTDKTVDWSEGGKEYFINELSDAVKHELLHASQYSGRDFADGRDGYDKRDDNYEYMTRPDEIEAYAMNIADELVRKAGGKEDALQLLRMAGKTASFKDQFGRFLSPNLMAYFSMYDWKAEHPVVKRLLKKIFTFISNMD
jgi:hypothetical protein